MTIPRIDGFVGRKREIRNILKGLADHPLAFIDGASGSGKSWLAARLVQEWAQNDINDLEVLWLDLELDNNIYGLWHQLGAALEAAHNPDLARYLKGEIQIGSGKWEQKVAILAAGLQECDLLVVLDNVQVAEGQQQKEGWQALFDAANRLDPGCKSRFFLLVGGKPNAFFRSIGVDEKGQRFVNQHLGGLAPDAIHSLAQSKGMQISRDEAQMLRQQTKGHALTIALSLASWSSVPGEKWESFARRLPFHTIRQELPDQLMRSLTTTLIAGLDQSARQVLQLFSLIRRPEPVDLLAPLVPDLPVQNLLETLCQRHLVQPWDNAYCVHELVQEIVVQGLASDSPEELCSLHQSLSEIYQAQGDLGETIHHLVLADEYDLAAQILIEQDLDKLSAAQLEVVAQSSERVWNELSARKKEESSTQNQYQLALHAGQAVERIGGYGKAIEWYDRALSVASSPAEALSLEWRRAWAYHRAGETKLANSMLSDARGALEAAITEGTLSVQERALFLIVYARILAERKLYAEAQETIKEAFRILGIAQDIEEWRMWQHLNQESELVPTLAQAYHAQGQAFEEVNPAQAELSYRRALKLYKRLDKPWMTGLLTNNLGKTQIMQEKVEEALQSFSDARQIALKLGDRALILPPAFYNYTVIRYRLGENWLQVEQDFKDVVDLLYKIDYKSLLPLALQELGSLLGRMGKWHESEHILLEKIDFSRKLNESAKVIEVALGQFAIAEVIFFRIEAAEQSPQSGVGTILLALETLQEAGKKESLLSVMRGIMAAELTLLQGDETEARITIEKAETENRGLKFEVPEVTGKLYEVQGMILTQCGKEKEAARAFANSLQVQADGFLKAYTHYRYALVLKKWNDWNKAREEAAKAQNAAKTLPAPWLADLAEQLLAGLDETGQQHKERESVEEEVTVDSNNVSIAAIHDLLLEAFTDAELRRFCEYRPKFKPVTRKFGRGHSFEEIVDTLIKYSQEKILVDELLAGIKNDNPKQFERFKPRIYSGS